MKACTEGGSTKTEPSSTASLPRIFCCATDERASARMKGYGTSSVNWSVADERLLIVSARV